jgi:hypothetical protein
MTPQELMDLPYAGMAEKRLRKAKKWDEWNGLPYKDFKVNVEYRYEETDDQWVSVKARCDEEAEELACEEVESDPDTVWGSAEVLNVKEAHV